MGLKGKILKFMRDISKDAYCYKLYTQAKSTSACGLPKGFFYLVLTVKEVTEVIEVDYSTACMSLWFSW